MAKVEIKLPKMGESVDEATLTAWLKNVGDTIKLDDGIAEVATDKVDTEVPSEIEGILVEQLFKVGDILKVDQAFAIVEVEGTDSSEEINVPELKEIIQEEVKVNSSSINHNVDGLTKSSDHFYSPLVKNIAAKENISMLELDSIKGTGADNRLTKNDLLDYIKNRSNVSQQVVPVVPVVEKQEIKKVESTPISLSSGDEIIEMTRMGKLISQHMTHSVHTSAHVQSFIEADVTNMVKWREKVKSKFEKAEGEKLTFTPILLQAVAKTLRDYPMMNISVDGDTIIKKKTINLGMATSLDDGNLIVPVIKNADQLNMVGMAKAVNNLANRARKNQLKPDDIQGGTFTVTNIGSFGSIFGTPIINQPQVGILALGAIRKTPAVIETADGDFIGIRHKMYLSISYDHRVVNGALGGMFVKRVAEYLEQFDINQDI
ncbi:MAG: dihydrolipoamide acetyltransferase family protein [Flavobacteriaceae bacterium]|nr:dihydrolipoamide acetyltransferase family protein [Flavobacteriaceae bacterium]